MEPNSNKKTLIIIAQVFQVAYTIIGTLILGIFIGYLIDKLLKCTPIFLILGSILGLVESFRQLMKIGRVKDDRK